jgi:hypothetical protein
MLITLPGPGASLPPAIDVEVVRPATVLPKPVADPATTSALPKLEDQSAQPRSEPLVREEAAKPAAAQSSPVEVPPDDMPQQVSAPDTPAPAGIDALTPEPLSPILVMAPTLAPPAPEEVRQVHVEPDVATTSSTVPVEMNPAAERTGETVNERTAPPPPPTVSREAEPTTEPQPEVARANPKEETPEPASPAEGLNETEPTPPVAKPAAPRKAAPQAAPKAKAPSKGSVKAEPASAKKRPVATAKRPVATAKRPAPQTPRVVRRPQTSIDQGIMSLFSLKPPAGTAAKRRPVVRQ